MMGCSSVVEQLTVNQFVAGSSPAIPVCHHSTVVVQGFCKAKVASSNLADGIGVVVQLVRAPACHAGSCEFDPRQSRIS